MTSDPNQSSSESQYRAFPHSAGTYLTEINSGKVCGLSYCSGEMSMEEKIALYLASRGN